MNSRGFLLGVKDRLRCDAELIDPPAAIGAPRVLPRKLAKWAWQYFQKHGADLVVRLTDADGERWQDVQRSELDAIPEQAREMWVCGVAVDNVEDWLHLDVVYLAKKFELIQEELEDVSHRTGRIKRAIGEARKSGEGGGDVVAQFVRDAPPAVFRRWLNNDALRAFYSDCRSAATRAECETPNELGAE